MSIIARRIELVEGKEQPMGTAQAIANLTGKTVKLTLVTEWKIRGRDALGHYLPNNEQQDLIAYPRR